LASFSPGQGLGWVRLLVRARERRAAAVGWDPLVRARCAATRGDGAEGALEIQRAMPDRRLGWSLVELREADSTPVKFLLYRATI